MDLLTRFQQEPLPFAKLLGIELVSAAPDRIVAQMTVREDLCTSPAVLHGGAIMAFADTLGALGTIANLAQTAASKVDSGAAAFGNAPGTGRKVSGASGAAGGVTGTVTIESKTNFLSPAPLGERITGEATPVHLGRRTTVWQTRVTTPDGKLVAVTTQTQLVLAPAQ